MFSACLEKQKKISALFSVCSDKESKYQKIIDMGRKLAPFQTQYRTSENVVSGCQSIMFLRSYSQDGLVFFEASSEALISAGLAAILIEVYSGERAETILKCPPQFLETLGISASLTPSRANGLYSIHLRMKQDALKIITL